MKVISSQEKEVEKTVSYMEKFHTLELSELEVSVIRTVLSICKGDNEYGEACSKLVSGLPGTVIEDNDLIVFKDNDGNKSLKFVDKSKSKN